MTPSDWLSVSMLSLLVASFGTYVQLLLLQKRHRGLAQSVLELEQGLTDVGTVELLEGDLTKSTEDAMCWDIYSPVDVLIPVGQQVVITTNVKTRMHKCGALILSRSGLAVNQVTHRAGVIDSKYPDYWGVILRNEGPRPHQVRAGDRIAQVYFVSEDPVEVLGGVINGQQRTGGFGSTGK